MMIPLICKQIGGLRPLYTAKQVHQVLRRWHPTEVRNRGRPTSRTSLKCVRCCVALKAMLSSRWHVPVHGEDSFLHANSGHRPRSLSQCHTQLRAPAAYRALLAPVFRSVSLALPAFTYNPSETVGPCACQEAREVCPKVAHGIATAQQMPGAHQLVNWNIQLDLCSAMRV
jgi:hypothetical protein